MTSRRTSIPIDTAFNLKFKQCQWKLPWAITVQFCPKFFSTFKQFFSVSPVHVHLRKDLSKNNFKTSQQYLILFMRIISENQFQPISTHCPFLEMAGAVHQAAFLKMLQYRIECMTPALPRPASWYFLTQNKKKQFGFLRLFDNDYFFC